MAKEHDSWKNVKTFDDVVIDEEKIIIDNIEKKVQDQSLKRCPCLRRIGEFFYWCSKDFKGRVDKKPSLSNPIYHRRVGVVEMQMHCTDSYNTCCFYKRILRRD